MSHHVQIQGKLQIDHWREKATAQAQVKAEIINHLFAHLPHIPRLGNMPQRLRQLRQRGRAAGALAALDLADMGAGMHPLRLRPPQPLGLPLVIVA